jgi:CRP-like cAMP-binding protein
LSVLKALPDRTVVFEKGEAATHAYYLHEGAIEIVHDDHEATGIVVKILAAPHLFGFIELAAREPSYLESVRTLGPCSVIPIPVARGLSILAADPELCLASLENTATAFCAAARFEAAHLMNAESKLANLLLALGEVCGQREGGRVRLTIQRSQGDFAASIGTSERQVSRILAEWQEKGFIEKRPSRYEIVDDKTLIAMAGALYGSLVSRDPRAGAAEVKVSRG